MKHRKFPRSASLAARCKQAIRPATKSWPLVSVVLVVVVIAASQAGAQLDELGPTSGPVEVSAQSDKNLPSNHRSEPPAQTSPNTEKDATRKSSARNGRQYDGPLSASGTGSYASLSGDSGAYVGSAGMSPLAASYSGATGATAGGMSAYTGDLMNSNMYSQAPSSAYHDQLSLAARTAGYPSMHLPGGYPSHAGPPSTGSFNSPLATMFSGGHGGLLSSSSFPLMAKGFDLAEIVCTAIAVAIGAVIVGAPFILLYLFVMNQMQGNGPSAIGPSGGAISLTGPSSSTTVTGRKKRHTNFSEALFKQLSPLVNSEHVAQTFKALLNSMAKYEI